MNLDKAIPNRFRDSQLLRFERLVDHVDIDVLYGRQKIPEQRFYIGIGTIRAGKCRGSAKRVRFDSATELGVSRALLALAQKKIAVTPGNIRRSGIGFLGLYISFATFLHIAVQLVSGGEIQPGIGVIGIQRDCSLIRCLGAFGVGLLEVVLLVATEQVPII